VLDTRSFDVVRYLARLPLFSDIGDEALQHLAAGSSLRHVERGQMVFHQGDPCEHFHVVTGGQVKLFVVSPSGQEKIVEIIGPGGSFAEALMFLGKPCMVSAQALVDTLLVSVSRRAVMDELGRDHQFALRMLAGLSRRLHGLVHDVQAYALQNGVQRVVGYLLNQREVEDCASGEAITVSLPVSKSALASRLSLTPEYFSRVLRELEDARLIRVDRRDIHILDARRLAAYPG
jgi:CRP/FNR family transcriptional regulator, dissimilatory nitrate respiration regulator